jgi:hypothetical protein
MMSAGVNSIAAVRLASKLRSEIGFDLPATLIFEYPTPRAVSAHLESLGCAESLADPNAVTLAIEDVLTSMASPTGDTGSLFSAGAGVDDEWLRTLTQLGSTPEGLPMSASMLRDCQVKAFHMQQLYQLQPEDSVPLVSKSLRALSDVHHMLRSGHTPPLFWVNQARLELDVVDPLHGRQLAQAAAAVYSAVSRLAAHASGAVAADEEILRELMQAFCDLSIDYATATFRARMVCVRERAVCLVLAIHHVVLDGPSQQIVHTGVCVREMYMCVRA